MSTNRRERGWKLVAVAAAAVTMAIGCQEKDVGQPCTPLEEMTESLEACGDSANDLADYFESGATIPCDNFVCVHSAGQGCLGGKLVGMCSKSCVSNADCFSEETGLVCRQVVLSEAFIRNLQQTEAGKALLAIYLQDLQSSSYCAKPRK